MPSDTSTPSLGSEAEGARKVHHAFLEPSSSLPPRANVPGPLAFQNNWKQPLFLGWNPLTTARKALLVEV